MDTEHTANDLGIPNRVRRSLGRSARVIPATAKVTREEQGELEAAAKREGKALSEWAREVLLERARKGSAEGAVFTELIAHETARDVLTQYQPQQTGGQ